MRNLSAVLAAVALAAPAYMVYATDRDGEPVDESARELSAAALDNLPRVMSPKEAPACALLAFPVGDTAGFVEYDESHPLPDSFRPRANPYHNHRHHGAAIIYTPAGMFGIRPIMDTVSPAPEITAAPEPAPVAAPVAVEAPAPPTPPDPFAALAALGDDTSPTEPAPTSAAPAPATPPPPFGERPSAEINAGALSAELAYLRNVFAYALNYAQPTMTNAAHRRALDLLDAAAVFDAKTFPARIPATYTEPVSK